MSKYHAIKVWDDGQRFDSQMEHRRYRELKTLLAAGAIANLRLRVRYRLVVQGHDLGYYEADFNYDDVATGAAVVEDCKGVRTPVYQLKKKLVKAIHGLDILETTA